MLEVLKRELKNRKGYQNDLININRKIAKAVYEMEGVKGVRFDKPRVTMSPQQAEEIRLERIEEYNDLLAERNRIVLQLKHIDKILEALDEETREAVEMCMCEGNTLRKTALAFNMSKSGLDNRINRELKKAEKKEKARKRTRPL